MSKGSGVTPERTAELLARLEKIMGLAPKLPEKPKVVMNEGEAVRDAVVRVSPHDPNYSGSDGGVVRVRRSDYVTIRMDLYEQQQREKAEDRRRRRELDPYRMGLYGPVEDD